LQSSGGSVALGASATSYNQEATKKKQKYPGEESDDETTDKTQSKANQDKHV
jgi:hypothetical protein